MVAAAAMRAGRILPLGGEPMPLRDEANRSAMRSGDRGM